MNEENQELISMEEAIEALKTTRPTFYRWLRSGKIKGMKVGRQWRFYPEDIERFLKGDKPLISLPVNIEPLIHDLKTHLDKFKIKYIFDEKEELEQVVLLISLLAIKMNSSDIHLESIHQPNKNNANCLLRFRIEGKLQTILEIHNKLFEPILNQWKIMSSCQPDTFIPQEGQITFNYEDLNTNYELKCTFLPTNNGSSLIVRLINLDINRSFGLDELKFSSEIHEKIIKSLNKGWGMVLANGPTGSGKTTTLYAMMIEMSNEYRKTICLEDIGEFHFPWVTGVPVNPEKGFEYLHAIKIAMKSDPDILTVNEIINNVCLHLLQQISLTGHLVLTSLHSTDSVQAIIKMIELSDNPYSVSESVNLIVSQRLVRKLCPDCKEKQKINSDESKILSKIKKNHEFEFDFTNSYIAKGCQKCSNSGYRGRMIIAEAIELTPEIRNLILNRASEDDFYNAIKKQNTYSILLDGLNKVSEGLTTFKEVYRVMGQISI